MGSQRARHNWATFTSLHAEKSGLPRGQRVHLPVQETQEMWVQSLGQEDPLEEKMATHCSSLAWRIPGTEEPGGLRSMGLQTVGLDWVSAHTHMQKKVTLWGFGLQVRDWKLGEAHDQGAGGLPRWLSGKAPACQCRKHWFNPWFRKIPYATEQLSPCATTIGHLL